MTAISITIIICATVLLLAVIIALGVHWSNEHYRDVVNARDQWKAKHDAVVAEFREYRQHK